MTAQFPFSVSVEVFQGAVGPLPARAQFVSSLPSANGEAAVVLYQDQGSALAGLYAFANNRWNFVAPYSAIDDFVVDGGSIAIYVDLAASVAAPNGSTVYRNGVLSTATTLAAGNLLWAAIVIQSSGGGSTGTVTSVSLSMPTGFTVSGSPITTTGTLAVTLASQTAGQFLASPTGAAGVPAFRSLAATDLPLATNAAVGAVKQGTNVAIAGDGTISVATGAGYALPIATTTVLGGVKAGTNVTIAGDGTISVAAPGVGTVTSVALGVPTFMSVTGSPVTGAGTLTFAFNSEAAGLVFASPAGAAGNPLFRALANTDIQGLANTWSAQQVFTLSPTVPTLTATDNTTKTANTATVQLIAASVGSSSATTAVTAGHGQPYDIVAQYLPGIPTASEVILSFQSGRSITFSAGGALSWVKSLVAPTAGVVAIIAVNGTQVGTVTWTAANAAAAVNFAATVNLTAGQTLTVTMPVSPDATLSGITQTYGGFLT